MPIPTIDMMMLPLLTRLSDGSETTTNEAVDQLATTFSVSDDEKKQRLPAGTSFVFRNRFGWATTCLRQAGLISSPRRGVLQITKRGQTVLRRKPKKIDRPLLNEFEEYRTFARGKPKPPSAG